MEEMKSKKAVELPRGVGLLYVCRASERGSVHYGARVVVGLSACEGAVKSASASACFRGPRAVASVRPPCAVLPSAVIRR